MYRPILKLPKTRSEKIWDYIGGSIFILSIFYIILAIAAFGLIMNLDEFLFSIIKTLISFAVVALIIYLIYYFFFLTEDQRKYKRAARKYKRKNRKH